MLDEYFNTENTANANKQVTHILIAVSFEVSPLQNVMTQINVHDRIHWVQKNDQFLIRILRKEFFHRRKKNSNLKYPK